MTDQSMAADPTIHVEVLRVATGDGRLARRDDAVLFLPAWGDGADAVLEAFVGAADEPATDAVSSVVLDREFSVPPLACLSWGPRLTLLVFGDLEVHTDHPAVPMLSGAGSRTWVEHTLRHAVGSVTVTVDPPTDGAPTDLVAGVVPAAGFALSLSAGAVRPAHAPAASRAGAAEPVADGVQDGPGDEGDAVRGEVGSTLGRERGGDVLDLPPPVGTQDLDSLDAIRSAVVGEPTTTGSSVPVDDSPPAASTPTTPLDTDREEVEPADDPPADLSPDDPPSDEPSIGGPPLVEATTCDGGHLSPAGSSTCRVCGRALSPDAEATTVRRPSLGVLRLDDGSMLPLDRNYRIGRKPTSDDRATAARIEGEKISRTHVEVTLRGWDVLVADCDSTNGTWVAPGPQERFRRVDPEVPVRIEPGAVLRLDQRTLTYDQSDG